MKEIDFKEFITLQRGFDLPERLRKKGTIPVVASTSITGYHNEHKVEPPGVVTGRSGALGEVQYIIEKFFPLNTTLWVKDFKGNLPRYVYYFLKTLDLKRFNSGAGVPTLNRNDLDNLEISIHDEADQKKIASVLSAYDDLIENNTSRIAILEEMARRIYEEWFVRFRFPGHEQVKMVESELGLIPEGWETTTIKDVCELIQYGYTTSAKSENTGTKFLRITDIVPEVIDWDSVPYCEINEKEKYKYLLEKGDIVVARTGATTGYAKYINKNHPTSIFASYLVRFRTNPDFSHYILGVIVESDKYKRFIKANISGAAQPQANAQVLASFPIIIPTDNLQKIFDSTVEKIFDLKENLEIKNRNLRQTSDLLLPKLISGEVDVSHFPEPENV